MTLLFSSALLSGTLSADYLLTEDAPLLLAEAGCLIVFAYSSLPATPLRALSLQRALIAIFLVMAVAWAGSSLIMERYGASRDEQIADFMAQYLRQGRLGMPIPPGLAPLRFAMLPLYAEIRGGGQWWVGQYYPLNSLLRAETGWLLEDPWLTGPLLLGVGLAGLWRTARILWPERQEAATVALLMGASSVQLLANAMTPYAMTAQFALEAWWIGAVVTKGPRAQGLAALIGLIATGVHQAHFHPQFALGLLIWLWLSGRRASALFQVVAVAAAWVFWDRFYRHWALDHVFGPEAAMPVTEHLSYIGRLLDLNPLPSIARFVAWQNVLLAPLAFVGARAALRDRDHPPTQGMTLSCAIGLLVTVDSVHSFGYRYLTGLLPCFCLLAADGWHRLGERRGSMPGFLLWGSVAFAAAFSIPFALWRAHADIHPYAYAYHLARSARADVVLIDGRKAAFLQDVVRFDDPAQRPLLLDMAKVPMSSLPALCRERVTIFDWRQASSLGMALRTTQPDADEAARRAEWLTHARCGTPLVVPR